MTDRSSAATSAARPGARSPRSSTTTCRDRASRPAGAARRPARPRCRRGAVLGEGALHQQPAGRPVGLEVDPGHELVAQQERQHVVAVDALLGAACRSRCGSGSRRAARRARAPRRPGRTGSAAPGPRPRAGGGRRGGGRPGAASPRSSTGSSSPDSTIVATAGAGGRRHPVVVGQAPRRSPPRGTARRGGRGRGAAPRRVRSGAASTAVGQHPLGQVVADLELAGAPGDRHPPDSVEVVEAPAGLATSSSPSAPWTRGSPSSSSRAVDGAAVGDLGDQPARQLVVGRRRHHLPRRSAVVLAPVLHRRPQLDRHEGLHVGPVLDQPALLASRRGPLEQRRCRRAPSASRAACSGPAAAR